MGFVFENMCMLFQRWRVDPGDGAFYGPKIDIQVFVNETLLATRNFKPVIWTQPLADHEVTLSTHWELDQTESSSQGEDNYVLIFEGQGWQKRI